MVMSIGKLVFSMFNSIMTFITIISQSVIGLKTIGKDITGYRLDLSVPKKGSSNTNGYEFKVEYHKTAK